ncbi:MAG: hypothetical protein LBQ63_01780 [Deltaproteobacteria bacterium]|jgi:uncharacterized protein with gpF-like domain|nr:hypothetical protein [Deltaproteobacteria bacterium]
MQSAGITLAKWIHSGVSKDPRSTHLKMHGKVFDLSEGLYDPAVGRKIQPGELINCRCSKAPLVPGFARDERDRAAYEAATRLWLFDGITDR